MGGCPFQVAKTDEVLPSLVKSTRSHPWARQTFTA